MKPLCALLALTTLVVQPIARGADAIPATNDQRMDKLEQRVDKIDRSLEQILLLLQSQQTNLPARPATAAVSTAGSASATPLPVPPAAEETVLSFAPLSVETALKPGVLQDVWLRPARYTGTVPTTPSMVTIRDTRGPHFQLGRYASERELASSIGKPLVQVWRCYLNIKTEGSHVLIAEFRRTSDHSVAKSQPWDDFKFPWTARLSINDQLLLDETNQFESAGKGALARTFTLDLKPGYYAVQLVTWLPEQRSEEIYDYKPLTFALRLREPGALKPRDLGAADYFCR